MLKIDNLEINYHQGWSFDSQLPSLLESSLSRDRELGYTFYGIHRADMTIKINKMPGADYLSRGQQKIFVWGMRIAQGLLLYELMGKQTIFLIDDLTSELDTQRQRALCSILATLPSQVFVTCIDCNGLDFYKALGDYKLFHVKHSGVQEVSEEKAV